MIHPTAVIHPKAELGPEVTVGPCAVIDEHVVIGARCHIGPHVYITGRTVLGEDNRVHAGCVLGDAPQDLKYDNAMTGLRIGNGNAFREHVTIHRSNDPSEETQVGSNNFLMANSHAGHNSVLGNRVIMANGAMLGGHVTVGDGAFISGNCMVHQFVRIGTMSLMQGRAGISKDLPPFTTARGVNAICGLNMVGLRRAGFTSEQRLELKQLYHLLFRGNNRFAQALQEAQGQFTSGPARVLIDFVAASKRGVCPDRTRAEAESEG
jgi:UDP-N-acetylglucosamine acyltransferase